MSNISSLLIRRYEASENGRDLIRVPDNEKGNFGVEYLLKIKVKDEKNALASEWRTPREKSEKNYAEGLISGKVYAPEGFQIGKTIFLKCDSDWLTASTLEGTLEGDFVGFLERLARANTMNQLRVFGEYDLIGKIESYS